MLSYKLPLNPGNLLSHNEKLFLAFGQYSGPNPLRNVSHLVKFEAHQTNAPPELLFMTDAPPPRRKYASSEPLDLNKMSKLDRTRRDNLRTLVDVHGGGKALAMKMGYRGASFISHMAGPNPVRRVTEQTARDFEERLGLERGALDIEGWDPLNDKPVAAVDAPMPLTPVTTAPAGDMVAEVLKSISDISDAENISVPLSKMPLLYKVVSANALSEHNGHVDPAFIRDLLQMLK